MSTVQQLLDDINDRYRNTFTATQKVRWMNQVQRNIYQAVRHEATPYYFTTVAGQAFYPLPSDCDIKGLEQVTLQVNSKGDHQPILYKRKGEEVNNSERFYSIEGQNLFLFPVPTTANAGWKVYLYYNKRPTELSDTALSASPDLDFNFHELLTLGTLERIAGARKDVVMKNNYAADYAALLDDYEFMYKMTDPEFVSPIDVLPKIPNSTIYTSNSW